MKYQIVKLLPKNFLSRVAGILSETRFPSFILQSFIKVYCKVYKINLDEMADSVKDMKCFTQFFTRKLKDGVRPINNAENAVVSPVDGTLAEWGEIHNGMLTQVKGIHYSLLDLVGEDAAREFSDGYFMTIYLSPADYHRIHAPVTGDVKSFSYIAGDLWPVNDLGVKKVSGLFCLNERLITYQESKIGKVATIKVGATVVGKIKVAYSDVVSNVGTETFFDAPVAGYPLNKGDEMGLFALGSTVVLLFQKDKFEPLSFRHGQKLKMGERIGAFQTEP